MTVGKRWITQGGSRTLDTLHMTRKMGGGPAEEARDVWCWSYLPLFFLPVKLDPKLPWKMKMPGLRGSRWPLVVMKMPATSFQPPDIILLTQSTSNRTAGADSHGTDKQTMSRSNYSNQRVLSTASESMPFSRARIWWCPYYHRMKTYSIIARNKKCMHMFSKRHVQEWSQHHYSQ